MVVVALNLTPAGWTLPALAARASTQLPIHTPGLVHAEYLCANRSNETEYVLGRKDSLKAVLVVTHTDSAACSSGPMLLDGRHDYSR